MYIYIHICTLFIKLMCTNFRTKSKSLLSKKTLDLPLSRSSSLLKIFLTVTFSSIQDNAPHWNTCISVKNNSRTFLLARRARNAGMFLENEERERERKIERERETKNGKEKFRISLNLTLSLPFSSLFCSRWSFFLLIFFFSFLPSPLPSSPYVIEIIMSNSFRLKLPRGKISKVCRGALGIFTEDNFYSRMNSSILNHRLTWQPFR